MPTRNPDAPGGGERGEPGSERCRSRADADRAGDRGAAVVLADRCLRAADVPVRCAAETSTSRPDPKRSPRRARGAAIARARERVTTGSTAGPERGTAGRDMARTPGSRLRTTEPRMARVPRAGTSEADTAVTKVGPIIKRSGPAGEFKVTLAPSPDRFRLIRHTRAFRAGW